MQNPVASDKAAGLVPLTIGAIGVVFGDIGTSPLYALRECFAGPHPLAADVPHILGVVSLIFWSVMLSVSLKYGLVIMRADNRGEGGSLALLALVQKVTSNPRAAYAVMVLGIFAAALFYGDSMITPAISVLSAVEGLEVRAPALGDYVVPITLFILGGLFLVQRRGTALLGILFGPVMITWFSVLAILGVIHILRAPEILWALNPLYAVNFFILDGWTAFLALGSVVLAVTGAEALYSDMGHFGRKPIRTAWFAFVFPALMLNYFGQGALLLHTPEAAVSPLYHMVPDWGLLPLVGLATAAAVIASQAVISGAFSVTQQAIQLGYLPRLKTLHTSRTAMGQIYVPFVNWMLLIAIAALVVGFGSSSNLASAYGIAVTGTMLIDGILILTVITALWRWKTWAVVTAAILFFIIDMSFFIANATKITHGGWFPLVIAIVAFILLTTWKRGRALLMQRLEKDAMSVESFLGALSSRVTRVPGTAVFMTGHSGGIPHALLHNLKHNKVLHERNLLLTVHVQSAAHVPDSQRLEIEDLSGGFTRVLIHYGFMDDPDVPAALALGAGVGMPYKPMDTSFFLSRETIIPSRHPPGMAIWREKLFAWMSRNAASAMDFFKLPTNRVVELGTQIEI